MKAILTISTVSGGYHGEQHLLKHTPANAISAGAQKSSFTTKVTETWVASQTKTYSGYVGIITSSNTSDD